ncbi:hypothetical protein [Chroococcidiopsis sp. SAG 2025]|uniref:hypothetical protein n=1 Tax=Chroococcidiopsis sp. SAG 2025 TaxID=171389 RepID=UPI0029370D7F|nr:hypothetical protein [Chroococcidiopsis sp. SAG 2025]
MAFSFHSAIVITSLDATAAIALKQQELEYVGQFVLCYLEGASVFLTIPVNRTGADGYYDS